jgi:hypothetical protein
MTNRSYSRSYKNAALFERSFQAMIEVCRSLPGISLIEMDNAAVLVPVLVLVEPENSSQVKPSHEAEARSRRQRRAHDAFKCIYEGHSRNNVDVPHIVHQTTTTNDKHRVMALQLHNY